MVVSSYARGLLPGVANPVLTTKNPPAPWAEAKGSIAYREQACSVGAAASSVQRCRSTSPTYHVCPGAVNGEHIYKSASPGTMGPPQKSGVRLSGVAAGGVGGRRAGAGSGVLGLGGRTGWELVRGGAAGRVQTGGAG